MKKDSSIAMTWCPQCGYWVPEKHFHAEYDKTLEEEGVKAGLLRVCDNCLEGTPDNPFPVFKPKPFQYDPHREDTQCVFCDSYNTEELDAKNSLWRCKNCGETFIPDYIP